MYKLWLSAISSPSTYLQTSVCMPAYMYVQYTVLMVMVLFFCIIEVDV